MVRPRKVPDPAFPAGAGCGGAVGGVVAGGGTGAVDVVVAAVVVGALVVVVTFVVTLTGTLVVTGSVVVGATVTRRRGVSPPPASATPIPPNPRMTSTASTRMRTGVSDACIRRLTQPGFERSWRSSLPISLRG